MADTIIKIECFFVTQIVSRLRNVVHIPAYTQIQQRDVSVLVCVQRIQHRDSHKVIILTRGSVKNWCYSTENPEIEWETIP